MRKLEELFNLPPNDVLGHKTTITEEIAEDVEETKATLALVDQAIDKIDIALPTVRDLDASDKEMDDIADLATTSFKDLVDLAMNVEARFSGPILQSASTLLGHAVTAKVAKMDKKLKMIDLQLKKARLDKMPGETKEAPIDGKGTVVDRTELLREILARTDK